MLLLECAAFVDVEAATAKKKKKEKRQKHKKQQPQAKEEEPVASDAPFRTLTEDGPEVAVAVAVGEGEGEGVREVVRDGMSMGVEGTAQAACGPASKRARGEMSAGLDANADGERAELLLCAH